LSFSACPGILTARELFEQIRRSIAQKQLQQGQSSGLFACA
jgi:hypothetical protein